MHIMVCETPLQERVNQNGHSGFPLAAATWGDFYICFCTFLLSFEFFTATYVLSLQSKDGNFAEELKAPASGYLGYRRYTPAACWSREWRWRLLLIWPTTEVWKRDPGCGSMAGLWLELLPQPERCCRSDELRSWLFWLNRERLWRCSPRPPLFS